MNAGALLLWPMQKKLSTSRQRSEFGVLEKVESASLQWKDIAVTLQQDMLVFIISGSHNGN